MNNRKSSEAKSSITAIAVAMAYTRALSNKYHSLENRREVNLALHLWNVGRQSLGWSNWALTGAISYSPYSAQETFFNSVVIPGYDSIILYRKLMIQSHIKAAIARGIKQIIFLGGGYDVRAIITATEFPEVKVYEVDRGETRLGKLKGIKTLPQGIGFDAIEITESENALQLGANLKFVDCDLGEDNVKNVLEAHGFNADEDSLIIAEGLTTYLNKENNEALLRIAKSLLTDNSELLISYLSSGVRKITSIEQTALNDTNEVYQFTLSADKVIPFTSDLGLAVSKKFDATSHLRAGGDAAATYHEAKPDGAREQYYLLRKADGMNQHTSISNVPQINFVPPVQNQTSYYCNML